MHESFASRIRNLTETLAVPNGGVEHDKTEGLKEEKSLKNWLRKTSLHNILTWFDATEMVRVYGVKPQQWRTENTKRDRLFIQRLGIKQR